MLLAKTEKKNQHNGHSFEYSTEFQAMLDNLENEDCTEESSRNGEKKRRLSLDQVKALEKVFEEDNKLEAEQKVRVAQELGLQPRQVAIWFQNRRARWKVKRLERDYGVLKASYEALKVKFDELEKEKEGLVAEVKELRAKLGEDDNTKSNHSVQEATLLLESDNNISEHRVCPKPKQTNPSDEIPGNANSLEIRDGLSEMNCTLLLNEENDLNPQLLTPRSTPSSSVIYEGCSSSMSSSWMSYFQLMESRAKGYYQHQFVKVEEQSTLFSTEDFHQQYFLS
ncbi:hypothetical protein RHGRI_021588 [Rhododendron griersonianum]|uniref:Homeobox-leucine zipper protein n=1 Tax=Rhododendron griersonianum TaxID=479676 RepID=A0AAV6JQY1_9ERIC|nr:hypothetical protein RHGRI_021588 [Rhododendron griersonianum]